MIFSRPKPANNPAPVAPAATAATVSASAAPATTFNANLIIQADNFLLEGAFKKLLEYADNQPMDYGSRSNSKNDPHGHWLRKFVRNGGKENLADLSFALEDNDELQLLHQTWSAVRDKYLPGYCLVRCYMNGYTYGTDGYFHTDSKRGDENTAILYMNHEWEPDWAGETVFLDQNEEILKSVLPKPNRLVIFPGEMRHAARSVSRKCTELRKTLIFKARKPRSETFEKLSLFLRLNGATDFAHKDGSLHDHLVRVYALLENRGAEPAVCLAGGLHSIYGTNKFRNSLLDSAQKPLVAQTFGDYAEQLAQLFCNIDRPRTLENPAALDDNQAKIHTRAGKTIDVPRKTFDDLRLIECANLLDQGSLKNHPALQRVWGTGDSNAFDSFS